MKKLPLTNKHKFKKVKYNNLDFDTPFEFKEYFYTQGADKQKKETLHGSYKHGYELEEGIQIRWGTNHFNIHFANDNYVILTNKMKK